MPAVEQPGFEIAAVEERDDLVLAPPKQEVWTPGSTSSAAERAAKVVYRVLGIEEKWAQDQFTGQLEAMELTEVAEGLIPIVSVTVGAEDNNGRVLTPSHVIKGHDKLTTIIPPTSVWPEMYANRPPEWWNKRRSTGDSELIKAPLQLVLADAALRGTKKEWDKQQVELNKLINDHSSDITSLEGMTPLDWEMMDADAIINDTERPDRQAATRFVQHEQDRSDAYGAYGPGALVRGGQALLGGWYGFALPGSGFRAVMGQKQTS